MVQGGRAGEGHGMGVCRALVLGEARVSCDGERGAQTAHGSQTRAYEQAKGG
jgi:hypothetical protein